MIDAALVSHPDAMCIALKKLNLKLKDGGPLLMSRIKTGLNDLVCMHVCGICDVCVLCMCCCV